MGLTRDTIFPLNQTEDSIALCRKCPEHVVGIWAMHPAAASMLWVMGPALQVVLLADAALLGLQTACGVLPGLWPEASNR